MNFEELFNEERICKICDKKFRGLRSVCSDECFSALRARIEYTSSMRPLGYQSMPRKTFLVQDYRAGRVIASNGEIWAKYE